MKDFEFLHNSYENNESANLSLRPAIYLVEDDSTLGKVIKKFLEKKFDLQVNYFSNPSDCLLALDEKLANEGDKSQIPFILLSDISFDEGGADGLLLIDLLKEKGHKFSSIVMTGFASIETAITATKKGVFHYLTKPFDLEALVGLLVEAAKKQLSINIESYLRSSVEIVKATSFG